MEWSTILDIIIILLLVVDIIIYHRTYGLIRDVSIITSYVFNYLKQKDDKF